VLAEIWIGNITMWDDPSIRALNPDMTDAELPHVNITLAFDVFGVLDLTGVYNISSSLSLSCH
jgi:ABC-type phosphate transport system substrate-binding protein